MSAPASNGRPVSPITYKWSPNTPVLTNRLLMNTGVVSRNAVAATAQIQSEPSRFASSSSMQSKLNHMMANSKSFSQPHMHSVHCTRQLFVLELGCIDR